MIILIGTKADLIEERKVTWENAKDLADRFNMIYLETSAKTGQGIQESLRFIAEAALNKKLEAEESSGKN